MTILFSIGALNAFFLAFLMSRQRTNAFANRLLVAVLAIVGARLLIYVLGFGGIYDQHPWMTFVPLDLSAGIAPLLWCYCRAMTATVSDRWRWHLLPMGLQFLYQLICFALPMPLKWEWYAGGHTSFVEPIATIAILGASSIYLAASWRAQANYQRWLDRHYSNREAWRLTWLRGMLIAFAVLLFVVTAMMIWQQAVEPVSYRGRIPAMVGFCALAYCFGLLGWKNAQFDGPREPPASDRDESASGRVDRTARTADWLARIETSGWWKEEGLSLGDVAGRLALSERSLSRGLTNAGTSFNAAINGMRVKALQDTLRDPGERRDLLTLALDHGFASKASFNRAFREFAGTTPSQWRRDLGKASPPVKTGMIEAA